MKRSTNRWDEMGFHHDIFSGHGNLQPLAKLGTQRKTHQTRGDSPEIAVFQMLKVQNSQDSQRN